MSNNLFRPAIALVLGGLFCQFAQASLLKTSTPTSGVVVVGGIVLLFVFVFVVRAIANGIRGSVASGGASARFKPEKPRMGMNNPMMGANNMASRISTVDGS